MAGEQHDRTGLWLLATWLVVTAAWWALALAPVADPPPWLAAARAVCFGSTPTGLPDTYGWMLLVVAPGSMLGGVLATWGSSIGAEVASAWQRPVARTVLLAAVAVIAGGGAWAASRVAEGLAIASARYDPEPSSPLPASYPRLDLAVPEIALVDQHGTAFTAASLRGRVTVLTFAFAHCRTVCPVIVATLRRLAEHMGAEAPQIAVVTLDPWRDPPSRLAEMHREWKLPPEALVLSGDAPRVTAALDALKVPWQRNENDGDVVHPPLVYVVDADGRVAYGFNNPTVDWLAEAARRLAGARGPTVVGAHAES